MWTASRFRGSAYLRWPRARHVLGTLLTDIRMTAAWKLVQVQSEICDQLSLGSMLARLGPMSPIVLVALQLATCSQRSLLSDHHIHIAYYIRWATCPDDQPQACLQWPMDNAE